MTSSPEVTDEELLGVEACRAADALAASAPPLTPQQRADLAVLLRRPRRKPVAAQQRDVA
jgi:hypothetical protein